MEYTATLFYLGADGSEYAQDKAAGRLDRRKLTLACKPKNLGRETKLGIVQGHVVLSLPPIMPDLMIDEERHFAEDLVAAIDNATAPEEFIESRFGPAGD